jgi:hypothetical protein
MAYPMKKKILIVILSLILVLAATFLYLNAVYLPAKLRTTIVSTLEKQLNARVSLGSLKYNLVKGIVIDDLRIYEAASQEEKPILSVKEISFNLLYLPLFKNKTIIIPHLRIEAPQVNIIRLNENEWNIYNLRPKNITAPPSDFSFLVYKVSILRARAFFTDRSLSPNFSRTIPEINCRAHLALPKKIKFNLEAKLSGESVSSLLFIRGDIDLKQKLLTAGLDLNDIDLMQFQPYYNGLPCELKSGAIKQASLKISGQKNKILVSSRTEAKNLEISKTPYDIKGDCIIMANFNVNPQEPSHPGFGGIVVITDAAVSGVPILQNIGQIKGAVNFNKEGLKTENLQGISHMTALAAKGTLADFSNPKIEAKIFASPPLERLQEIFSDQLMDWDFAAEGRSQLVLEISGLLNETNNLAIKGNASISEASLSLPQLPKPLEDIEGQIEFDKDSLRWQKLSAGYAGTTYACEGSLNNFASPHVELTLGSKLLSLSAKMDIQEKNLSLSQWQGKYLNSSFDFTGSADLNRAGNPLLDLTGKVQLNLPDLAKLLPRYKSRLESLKPEGLANLDVSLRGKLNNWRQWLLSIAASSPQISLQGLKLQNLNLALNQQDEAVKNLTLTASAYSGSINISGNADLSEEDLPGVMNLSFKKIDLEQLKLDTPWKDKPTSGKLSLVAQIQGPFKNTRALRGSGALLLNEGNLGEMNLLKGLGSLLFTPEFRKIVFKELGGDFVIENGLLYTSNLEVKSDEVNLSGEGSVDFAGNLDFTLNAQFNPDLIQDSRSLKKPITSIFSTASGLVIKLTGNVQKPKYKVIPVTGDIIKRVKEFFFEDILR